MVARGAQGDASVRGPENGFDRGDLVGNEVGIGVAVVRDTDDSGEHPAFAALPGGIIDLQSVAIRVAGVAGEQAPSDGGLDRGIADAAGSPVDDPRECAVAGEQG
jgi:hypothetical protein